MGEKFKTPREIEREQTHLAIVSRYKRYRQDNPKATPARVMRVLAQEYGYTLQGIRSILIRHEVYGKKN